MFGNLSALGQRWQWRTQEEDIIRQLSRYLEVSELLARVLAGRGQTAETALDFLEPTLRSLMPDPFHLKDMDKAIQRLTQAVLQQESIAIFGDYDVDGATSTALLIRYFRQLGMEVGFHIPDRQKEGYGPNAPALLALKERGVQLVITVDCGAVSFAPLTSAQEAGLDVIVIDHHKGAAELPPAVAVVNPNRLDEHSPCGHLAAVGVVFLTLVALNKSLRQADYFKQRKEPALMPLLDLVALGTVCDVVPLTGLNRAFVVQGLKLMNARTNPGIATLLEQAHVYGNISAYHLGFVIGPRINAGGRVGESDLGVKLLTSESVDEQAHIATLLEQYNKERQAIEMAVLEEAYLQAERQHNQEMLFVWQDGWHPGVIGIVASRLKDRYHKPVAVAAIVNGVAKASARSVSGVDIGAAIVHAREQGTISEGGGHSMAGGFSCCPSTLQTVHDFFCHTIRPFMIHYQESRCLKLDGLLTTRMASSDTIAELERAAPYGAGNPSPILIVENARIIQTDILKEQHIRLLVSDASGGRLKAMCFRAVGSPLGDILMAHRGKSLHLAGTLKQDIWQGQTQISFMVQDAMAIQDLV